MVRPRRKLFTVVFLTNLLLAGSLLLGFGWFSIDAIRGVYTTVWNTHIDESLEFVETRLKEIPQDSLYDEFKQLRKSMRVRITLIDKKGNILFDTDTNGLSVENHSGRPEFIDALKSGEGFSTRFSTTVSEHLIYHAKKVVIGNDTLVLRLSTPLVGMELELRKIYHQWVLAIGLAIMLGAFLAYGVSVRFIKPIQQLSSAAERFAQGHLDRIIPPSSLDETHSLADSLNRMAAQLDARLRSLALQRNETEAVLSSLTEGVVALDHESVILRVNQAFVNLFGLVGKSVLGRKLIEVVRNSELDSIQEEFRREGKVLLRDIGFVEESGERILQVRGSAWKDSHGNEIGIVLVFNDVSRVRRLEEMRSDFVSNVSHELKTPITAIKGYVETLQGMEMLKSDVNAERYLETVSRQADRLNAIVDDLLTLSRIEQDGQSLEIEFQQVDVMDLIESVVQGTIQVAKKNAMEVFVDCPEGIQTLGNPGLLEQALQNLVSNACKYSESGKKVWIKVRNGSEIRIDVIDQGFGIERKHLPRIFERFYRVDKARSRSQGGTGLGLAIAKHIALMHHGRIEVQSEVGSGSVFSMVIPNQTLTIPT